MKPQDSVSVVAGAVKLPSSVTTYLQNNIADSEDECFINGGVLQDTQYAWLSSGSRFTVVNVTTGEKIAAWTFGSVLRDFKTKITCVYKLPTPLLDQTMQILIGLECELIGGMVCLFHCNGSRILRAVQVACRVTCLQYVEDFSGGPLECFDGTVLIGTHGGAALAFDLNRQSCIAAILNGTDGMEILIKDELNVANLVVLSIDDIGLIVEQRQIACNKDDHIAIQLNEGCIHNLQYILHNPDNTIRLRDDRDNVFISSILYVPQLNSVILGLNFGAFQVWNLLTLELEFTSHVNADKLPITHLGFLEPCDDPRAFCYLWAIYSSIERHEEGFPLAAMYALTYHGKSSLKGRGSLYENFATCNLRFNIDLTNVETGNAQAIQMVGGRNLACHSLIKEAVNADDGDESVLNICQMVWECWPVSAIAPVQSLMILFDIDQWYKEQMPDCSMLETNRYMSVINLSDTLAHTASSYLCDVRINTESLAPFYSVQRLEEHFYPNALGYDCCCLTNTDITRMSTVGVQRQILASINEIGPSVLLHPTKLFLQCINCGLIPLYIEPIPTPKTPVPLQRQMILSIALEARLIEVLAKCASDWATGSHSSVGCTLQLLTDWAWSRALTLKLNGDQLTIPLFDHSGMVPDKNSACSLDNCTTQLVHIATLLNTIVQKCSFFMIPEAIKETVQRQKAVQIVSLYFQVVQWFLNVGLLPEFHIDNQTHFEESNERLPYPVDSLVRFYQNRRFKLHCLNGENPANENLQNKSCLLLFIDQFIRMECSADKLKSLWIDDGSDINGLYPPPSLYSLLKTYLIPDIKEEIKHALVLYVLVDYAMMFDDNRYECVIRRLMQFPTMFGLSNTAIKVTQAFWHLDHRDFEFALDQLQCVLAGGCLTQWQHNVVLSSLLAQKKTQPALQYLHVRKPTQNSNGAGNSTVIVYDDWEACCNLYLSRGLVLEAFNLVKDSFINETTEVKERRLVVFLQGCRKMNLLSKVLLMPLSQDEEEICVKYLKAFGDSESNNLLVMYYLQRSRYVEAQLINEDMKHLSSKGQLPYDYMSDFNMKKEHVPKTNSRDLLVELYCKTLPRITRNLAQYSAGNISSQKMSMPTPMTVSIQGNITNQVSYKSSFIQATIDKASETWIDKPIIARGLKRVLQVEDTPFICSPKMLKHSTRLGYVEKMSTTPDGDNSEATPSKRQKLGDSETTPTSEQITNPKLMKEMDQLLHTPTIERKSQRGIGGNSNRRCSNDRMSSRREATPQSILKVRRLLERATTPLERRHLAETDDEIETASQHTQSDNLSRSIRFNIPSASGTPSPASDCGIEMNESFSDLFPQMAYRCHSKDRSPRPQNVGASPRKSIHHSPETDVYSTMINAVSTPLKDRSQRGRNLVSASNSAETSLNTSMNEETYFSSQSVENRHTISRSPEVASMRLSAEFKVPEKNSRLHLNNNHESQLETSTNKDYAKSYTEERSSNRTKSFANISEKSINQISKENIGDDDKDVVDTELATNKSRVSIHEETSMKSSPDKSHLSSVRREISPKGPQPRRSLRQTPEREADLLLNKTPTPRRSLRHRSRTPEIESPNKVKSVPPRSTALQTSLRRSLARRVLESNILKTTEIASPKTVTTKEVVRIMESVSFIKSPLGNSILDESSGSIASDVSLTMNSKYDPKTTSKYLDSLRSQNLSIMDTNSILASDQSFDDVSDVSLSNVSRAAFANDSAVVYTETKTSSSHSVTLKDTRWSGSRFEALDKTDNISLQPNLLNEEEISLLRHVPLKEIENPILKSHKTDNISVTEKETTVFNDVNKIVDHNSSNSAESNSTPLVIDLESKPVRHIEIESDADNCFSENKDLNTTGASILNVSDSSDSCESDSQEIVGIFERDINSNKKVDTAPDSEASVDSDDEQSVKDDNEDEENDADSEDEGIEEEVISEDEEKDSAKSTNSELEIETEHATDEEDDEHESQGESEINNDEQNEDDEESQSHSNSRADSQNIYTEESSEDVANQAYVDSCSDVICLESSRSDEEIEKAEEKRSNNQIIAEEKTLMEADIIVLPEVECDLALPQFSSINQKTDITELSKDHDIQMTDLNQPNNIEGGAVDKLDIVEMSEAAIKPDMDTTTDRSKLIVTSPRPQDDINNMSLMTEESSILDEHSFSLKYSGDEETNEAPEVPEIDESEKEIINNPVSCDNLIENEKEELDKTIPVAKEAECDTPQKKTTRRMSTASSGKNETPTKKNTVCSEKVIVQVVDKEAEFKHILKDPISLNVGDGESTPKKSNRRISSASLDKDKTLASAKEIDSSKDIANSSNIKTTVEELNTPKEAAAENQTPKKSVKKSSPSSVQNKTPTRGKKATSNASELDLNDSLPLSETSISQSTRSASKKRLNTSEAEDKTPRPKIRRSSKKSLNLDDNDSVVSESNSMASSRDESKLDISFAAESSAKEDAPAGSLSRRKSRKSIFTFVKPNLSVIPEMSHTELDKTTSSRARDSIVNDSTNMDEYSSSRRLTRHQKSMLEKTMESSPARHSLRSKKTRGSSLYSDSSTIHEDSESGESAGESESNHRRNLAGDTMDPIKLLDKEEFTGKPDLEEALISDTVSVSSRASSIASDYVHFNAGTPKRAKSETGSIAALRKSRKKSVDVDASMKRETPVKIVVTPPSAALDESIADSPSGRPRRQSFNKAVEALSTPRRRRRVSTDSKNDTDGGSVSDSSTTGVMTPNNLKESRLADIPEAEPQKLSAITENDNDDTALTLTTPPKTKRRGKAASIHGYNMSSPDLNDSDISRVRAARKGRMSQLLTPLSKEEMIDLADVEKPQFRRRTVHKITNPIQFVMKKK